MKGAGQKVLRWERKSERRVSGGARGLPHCPNILHTMGSRQHVTANPITGGDVAVSGEAEKRPSAFLRFVAWTAVFGADSLNSDGCKPRSHGKTLRVTRAALGVPAQPAGDRPGLIGQGE